MARLSQQVSRKHLPNCQKNFILVFSVRLIVAVPFDTISDVHLHRLLDNVFQAMVLLVGLDDLVGQRNIDRTKVRDW